jgi:cobalt/nickel transport system ATP-binding protein
MMHSIEKMFQEFSCHAPPGKITICNVDHDNRELLSAWLSMYPVISIGAMGTRAKQRAENEQIRLDFTYGVIDKCILKALLGEDSLILTTESMVDRIFKRVEAYGKESGISISVHRLATDTVFYTGKSGRPV